MLFKVLVLHCLHSVTYYSIRHCQLILSFSVILFPTFHSPREYSELAAGPSSSASPLDNQRSPSPSASRIKQEGYVALLLSRLAAICVPLVEHLHFLVRSWHCVTLSVKQFVSQIHRRFCLPLLPIFSHQVSFCIIHSVSFSFPSFTLWHSQGHHSRRKAWCPPPPQTQWKLLNKI